MTPAPGPLGLCVHEGQVTFHCPVHGPIPVERVIVLAVRLRCELCEVKSITDDMVRVVTSLEWRP